MSKGCLCFLVLVGMGGWGAAAAVNGGVAVAG